MKLFIQIPCLNEESTLPQTLADLPKRIDGIALEREMNGTDNSFVVTKIHIIHEN